MNQADYLHYIESKIKAELDLIPKSLKEFTDILNYSLLPGGKRIRPMLLNVLAKELKVNKEVSLPFELALEFIHSYSLVHDDLPAMDDDDFRRGKPSVHNQFDEASAILAGDCLLNLAIETILNYSSNLNGMDLIRYNRAMNELFSCSGIKGMIGGQFMDMNNKNEASYLLEMLDKKTAALFKAAVTIPAKLSTIDNLDYDKFVKLGINIGRAFQILDDISDYEEDYDQNKNTFVTCIGIEESKEFLLKLKAEYLDLIKDLKLTDSEFNYLILKMIYERI
ncbi:MAG: polyprenyl synthetase family protein [Tissierellia bacterium]|nr:polyprenyl synthetase family protein [Tissierellia bacterium]